MAVYAQRAACITVGSGGLTGYRRAAGARTACGVGPVGGITRRRYTDNAQVAAVVPVREGSRWGPYPKVLRLNRRQVCRTLRAGSQWKVHTGTKQ